MQNIYSYGFIYYGFIARYFCSVNRSHHTRGQMNIRNVILLLSYTTASVQNVRNNMRLSTNHRQHNQKRNLQHNQQRWRDGDENVPHILFLLLPCDVQLAIILVTFAHLGSLPALRAPNKTELSSFLVYLHFVADLHTLSRSNNLQKKSEMKYGYHTIGTKI